MDAFMGGSHKLSKELGERQAREAVERAQTSQPKPSRKVRFSSRQAEDLFVELGLSTSDLGSPSGSGNRFTVADVREAADA